MLPLLIALVFAGATHLPFRTAFSKCGVNVKTPGLHRSCMQPLFFRHRTMFLLATFSEKCAMLLCTVLFMPSPALGGVPSAPGDVAGASAVQRGAGG